VIDGTVIIGRHAADIQGFPDTELVDRTSTRLQTRAGMMRRADEQTLSGSS
jgi:hypothetical protein